MLNKKMEEMKKFKEQSLLVLIDETYQNCSFVIKIKIKFWYFWLSIKELINLDVSKKND